MQSIYISKMNTKSTKFKCICLYQITQDYCLMCLIESTNNIKLEGRLKPIRNSQFAIRNSQFAIRNYVL
jgi:hypothetical protein